MAGCQGRATFGKQTWPGGRAATLRVRWQINCEPCADGLIHLSSRYKRLSRSNFILRFWLSHPDSFQLLLPPPLCTHPSPTMESISVRRLFLSLSSTLARFSLSRSRLRPLSPPLPSPFSLKIARPNFRKPHIEFYAASFFSVVEKGIWERRWQGEVYSCSRTQFRIFSVSTFLEILI